ncbi:MAG TPA: ATP-binding protein [Marmoricola sp.]|nr:ATP-binding protein [Marmoricola sp.]
MLPFTAASAGEVRRTLCTWLVEQGCGPDVVEDARLVASELVGNAVRHADPVQPGQPGRLLVSWHTEDGGLVLSVSDGGSGTVPQQRPAPLDAVGGRGLTIVDALAKRWWVEPNGTRSTVHALLPLPGPVPAPAS